MDFLIYQKQIRNEPLKKKPSLLLKAEWVEDGTELYFETTFVNGKVRSQLVNILSHLGSLMSFLGDLSLSGYAQSARRHIKDLNENEWHMSQEDLAELENAIRCAVHLEIDNDMKLRSQAIYDYMKEAGLRFVEVNP